MTPARTHPAENAAFVLVVGIPLLVLALLGLTWVAPDALAGVL